MNRNYHNLISNYLFTLLSFVLVPFFTLLINQNSFGQGSPNIILIICDDLAIHRDELGGYAQAITPNIDKLQSEGVKFTNAYSNAPVCNPSRASFITGLYPHTLGMYGYNPHTDRLKDNPVGKNVQGMFHFMNDKGFKIYGSGKIYHGDSGPVPWEDWGTSANPGPFPWNGTPDTRHPSIYDHPSVPANFGFNYASLDNVPSYPADTANGIPGYTGWVDQFYNPFKYNSASDRDKMNDEISADFALGVLGETHLQPFFLTIGFNRPHAPFYSPKEFYDLYDPDTLQIPFADAQLMDALSTGFINNNPHTVQGHRQYTNMFNADSTNKSHLKNALHAYLAAVSFADAQIGKILDSLNSTPYDSNTYVIVTSDNGMFMGEKEIIGTKENLWGPSSRIPLYIKGPEIPSNKTCSKPVSLIDLYPTIAELGKQSTPTHCEGTSFLPLAKSPENGNWNGPKGALVATRGIENLIGLNVIHNPDWQHFSTSTDQFRYLLSSANEEELFDILSDPSETQNLINNPSFNSIKDQLRAEVISRAGRRPFKKEENLLYNASFSDDYTGWVLPRTNKFDFIRIDLERDSVGSLGNTLKVKIDSIADFSKCLFYNTNIKLDSGKCYRASFEAKTSEKEGIVRPWLRKTSTNEILFSYEIHVDSVWKSYSSDWNSNYSTNRDLKFYLQFLESENYSLRNLKVTECNNPLGGGCNGDFERGNLGWSLLPGTLPENFSLDSNLAPEGLTYSSLVNDSFPSSGIRIRTDSIDCRTQLDSTQNWALTFKAISMEDSFIVSITIIDTLGDTLLTDSISPGKIWGDFSIPISGTSNIQLQNYFMIVQIETVGTVSVDDFKFQILDCNNTPGGFAFLDSCGTCVGGITQLPPCEMDCNGDWGGTAFLDDQNNCVGGNTSFSACTVKCPPNLIVPLYSPEDSISIYYPYPILSQDCWPRFIPDLKSGIENGGFFKIGLHEIQFSWNHPDGYEDSCTYVLQVFDASICRRPTSVWNTDLTANGATLHWEEKGIRKSHIAVREASNFNWKYYSPEPGSSEYSVSDLMDNTEYIWKVVDSCSYTDLPPETNMFYSPLDTFITSRYCVPSFNLQSFPYMEDTIYLNWSHDSRDIFSVKYGMVGAVDTLEETNIPTKSMKLGKVFPGKSYYWKVGNKCWNTTQLNWETIESELAYFAAPSTCHQPDSLRVIQLSEDSLLLSWEAPQTPYLMIAYRPLTPGSTWITSRIKWNNEFLLLDFIPGTYYEWKIKDLCGFSLNESEFGWTTIDTFLSPGIPPITFANTETTVFPNPSNGTFSIKLDELSACPQKAHLYNNIGKLMREWTFEECKTFSFEIPSAPSGIYFLQFLKNGQSFHTQPFQIKR